jgi:hypothetical protein
LRAAIADTRGLALNEGTPYRLAASTDGKKLRIAPDTAEFGKIPVAYGLTSAAKAIELSLENVTVTVSDESDNSQATEDDWITIGIFLPNGTCRQDNMLIEVHEADFPPMKVLLRGVTGTARIYQPDRGTGSNGAISRSSSGAKP